MEDSREKEEGWTLRKGLGAQMFRSPRPAKGRSPGSRSFPRVGETKFVFILARDRLGYGTKGDRSDTRTGASQEHEYVRAVSFRSCITSTRKNVFFKVVKKIKTRQREGNESERRVERRGSLRERGTYRKGTKTESRREERTRPTSYEDERIEQKESSEQKEKKTNRN
ncbi:hypothetical protein BDY24DRAFT_398049 [Mrakia frigida]|uniref:uncharacterized protein n=1 Tax=Mrakia frigida TaxID=29902 RepID=UPI003FCBFB8E